MNKGLLAVAAVCFFVLGCSKEMDLSGVYDSVYLEDMSQSYTGIDVNSCIEVRFSGDCESPMIETDVNLIPYVEVYQKKDVLMVSLAEGLRVNGENWRVVVTLPGKSDLSSVTLSGASTFTSDIPLTSSRFSLNATGASKFVSEVSADEVSLDLSGASSFGSGYMTCKQLELSASGASSARISGEVLFCNAVLSGASALKGVSEERPFSLKIDNCVGTLSGASSAWFSSDGVIECTLSGASSIHYIGSADISGSDVNSDGSSIVHEERWY